VAKLVEAGCRNAVALMGSAISEEQIERLGWISEKVEAPRIVLFLDRDQAGKKGSQQIRERLSARGFSVLVFDWDQLAPCNAPEAGSIRDPADMPVEQIRALRRQGIL